MDQLDLDKFKAEIHRTLISKLDLEKLSRVNSDQARQAVAGMVNEIILGLRVPLSLAEQEKLEAELLDEVFGLGPLEPMLADPTISDILVNDRNHVFIERGGMLMKVDTAFRDDRHLLQIIDRIVSRVGRRVMSPRPWWTLACRMGPASMPSFLPWRSTALHCRSVVSEPALWLRINWSR